MTSVFQRRILLLLAFIGLPLAQMCAAPTVATLVPNASATVNSLTTISVMFTEAATGVDASDLLINNDAALSVTGSLAGPYVFTFTQPAPGSVNVSWDFDHGIAGIGTGAYAQTTWNYTLIDTLAPTVAKIESSVMGQDLDAIVPLPGSTVGALTQAEVVFSENVLGVDAADLLVNGVAAAAVTGSGAGPYVFTFAPPAAGAVSFQWTAGHAIIDTAAAPNAFAGGSWNVTLSAGGQGNLIINEFLAANGIGLVDENAEQSGWIEIFNPGASAVSLAGWALTNEFDTPGKWIFPSRSIAAGGYLVVFASGKDRRPTSGNLHTNFKLNANGDYLALVGPQSPRAPVAFFPPDYNPNGNPPVTEYPPQRYDYSYGYTVPGGGLLRYFSPPTPNAVNSTATQLTGVTAKPQVSVGRGFFKDPFQLVMSCATAGATIRYTLDGSVPIASGTAYTVPLTVSATTVLRMVAFGTGTIPSETVTHSYIYLDGVLSQAPPPYDNPANAGDNTNPQPPSVGGLAFPVAWGSQTIGGGTQQFPGLITNLSANQVPADYGMRSAVYADAVKYDDTGAVNNATGKTNADRIKQGLRDLPILSVVLKLDDMFGTANGLYPNSTIKKSVNPAFEKPCSIEMILPDGSTAFATTTGITIHGNASRSPASEAKHGFALNFKGDYGAASLEYPLFPDSPAQKLDDIILRADYNSSWTHWDGGNQRPKGTRLRDAFCKDLFRGMGRVAGHHRYVNLFIDGIYWGTYDMTEKEAATFAANYFGGDKNDYDVYEQGALKTGTATAYTAMLTASNAGLATDANYEAMKQYLDVPEFIDYMLLHFYTGHQDWGDNSNKNWYAVRNAKTNGTFKYLPWDQENLLWDPTVNRTTVASPPSGLHTKLVASAQYKLDFADRVHKSMIATDGALLPAAATTRWNKWRGLLTNAIAGESARWGGYRSLVHQYSGGPYPFYKWNVDWVAEHTRLTGTYFPARTNNVLTQLRTQGLYPTQNAPQFQDNGSGAVLASQRVAAGYLLKMAFPTSPPAGTVNTGTIYYTIDGSDPRVVYSGAVAGLTYSTPVAINATTKVRARTRNGTTWSALNEAVFTVGFAPAPVRITEIMYNPPNANGGTSAEFIELQNTGATDADLSGYFFDGIDFIFPNGFILGPGDRLVLASNDAPATFTAQYPGVTVSGYFGGSLDNGGERIALLDATGRTQVSVEYNDAVPWPTPPDGLGYSLEIISPNGDPDDPSNWKASAVIKGTPGSANSVPAVQSVELSEVFTTGADFIELHNKTGSPVAIGGWEIRGSVAATIPGGTMIGANGFYMLSTALPANEGSVAVFTDAALGTRVDGASWGNQMAGASIGRVSGAWTLCAPTPGAANTGTPTAPASSLALNEWLANNGPGEDDWLELYNKHATLPAALQGVFVQTGTQLFQIKSLAFIAPLGWLQMAADEQPGGNHLDLKLDAAGTTLTLLDSLGATIEAITFGAQTQSFTSGRLPDGTGAVTAFPGTGSPGVANYTGAGYTGPVLNEVLARNVNGASPPWGGRSDWVELSNPNGTPFDLGGMKLGTPAGVWTFPAGTSIPANGWLAIWCDSLQPASTAVSADLNTGFDLGDASGAATLFNAAGQIVDSIAWGFQIPDRTIGRDAGVWKLLATATRGAANSAAATLGAVAQLRFNEWAAAIPAQNDWFELYNLDPLPVAMAGLYLTDDPSEPGRTKFQVAPLSFIAGNGWVKWEAANSPGAGRNHVNFTLDADAEYLRLSNNDATFSVIDSVSFGAQSATTTQGRILDGQTIQSGLTPTPGARNILPPAPFFTLHPLIQTVSQGSNVNFTVAATGSAPLTYQWKFNGVDLPGMTATTLPLSSVGPASDGSYTCVATNTAGAMTSNAASLLVQSTFAQWAAARRVSGTTGDSDGDGIANLSEFFHNLDPLAIGDRTALPQLALEPPTGTPLFLTLTYRVNARAILTGIEHQTSLTLGSWSTAAPDVTESLAPDGITGDPRVRVKFSIAPGETKKFLRLLLTQ